jgi:hypothetical protein
MEDTKISIANASQYPLSIVIVGVGKEKFDNMKELDDNVKGCSRDIVQFVPLVFLLLYILYIYFF